ncbi:hypothetical protein [Bacillus subtilis]|uniref:hypothetical protein n=1 Tax=Bacillus subtilis TaxID=1423 RepID=UPI002795A9EF|nr:hypothetical protein [Bacillus subtilis]
MSFLDDPNINWDAISALSNFAVAFVTLITVFITVYFSWNNVRIKYKMVLNKVKKHPNRESYKIGIINKGFIPITILDKGILIHKFKWKKREKQLIYHKNLEDGIKLDIAERDNITVNRNRINEPLLKLGFNSGDKVKLVAFFVDSSNKVFYKKFTVVVFNEPEQPELKLNTERIQNIGTD